MNFYELKRMYSRFMPGADDMGLGWLLIVVIIIIVLFVIMSGKKINYRIPFLPRFMNRVSFNKDDLAGLKDKASGMVKKDGTPDSGEVAAKTQKVSQDSSEWKDLDKMSFGESLKMAVSMLSGGQEKRYDMPTYMVISGDSHPQDKAMLQSISRLLGKKERLILGAKDNSDRGWYLFKKGCLVHHENQRRLIAELKQYRPERPLDGLVITLPVTRLMSESAIELERWAGEVYHDIWQTQQRVGFVLPIYLLLTETEKLQGFDKFWNQQALKPFYDHQFGWANPYNDSQAYHSSWIDEAITTICEFVRGTQLAIIAADNRRSRSGADVLLLAHSLEKLRPGLAKFCNELFSNTALQTPLMFRGFYFTGEMAEQASEERARNSNHLFLKDLFEQKVFAENRLAFAPRRKILSSNSKLRAYQYLSIITFSVLSSLLVMDSIALDKQTRSLVSAINNEPKVRDAVDIAHINAVLNHVADMDASTIRYLSMPFSWNTPFNDDLTEYFSRHIFAEVVFPAFECKMHSLLRDKLNNADITHTANDYTIWLNGLAENYQYKQELDDLVANTHRPDEAVQKMTELVNYLYTEKLPESFYKRSDLYIEAISRNNNSIPRNPYGCELNQIASEESWNRITNLARYEIRQIADEVAAPREFFEVSEQLQSLPSVVAWYNTIPEFADSMREFNTWFDHLNNYWLESHSEINECRKIHDALQMITEAQFSQGLGFPERFLRECEDRVSETMSIDNAQLAIQLYDQTHYPMKLTTDATKLFNAVEQTRELSYMTTPGVDQTSEFKTDFFWSTEQLNRAIALQEEYEKFAIDEYKTIWLPNKKYVDSDKYFAQGIALKQLQFAMNRHVQNAQVEEIAEFVPQSLRPVSQQEAYLAAAVGNFRKSMDSILSLLLAYKKLDFSESHKWLLELSQDHAFKLLQKVDLLYNDNRIFEPLQKTRWSAHQYNNALFGITSEGQLQDYLAAQAERVNGIAYDYAEPLIVFLLNTKGKYVNYELFGRWHNTLIELNKNQNKDPSNNLVLLEQFMSNQLAGVDQSNCFETTADLTRPEGSDVFAKGQRYIVERAIDHCNSYKADQIKREYAQVAALFDETLANRAPFSRSAKARNVSPREMRLFLKDYLPLADGLDERMSVLAWKDKSYKDARKFIQDLDKTAALFSNIIGTSSDGNASGIEMDIEFNVMNDHASFVRHLADWQLNIGDYTSQYPGEKQTVFWKPSDPVSLSLSWAKGSPYQAFAINGDSRLDRNLHYSADGVWSLLHFLKDHGTAEVDTESLVDQSKLLKFEANVLAKDAKQEAPSPNQLRAYLRMVLYGIDPETNQKVALEIPTEFPEFAPQTL